jgi:inorganic phosphate transporter, PiT family
LNYTLVERILWAWVLTIPISGLIAYALVQLFRLVGWIP